MNTHLGTIAAKLEKDGASFQTIRKPQAKPLYVCIFAGEEVARASTKSDCIKEAAKALGEPNV